MADRTWREYVATPATTLARVPADLDDDRAAAFLAGAGYLTGYLALTEMAKFRPGQTVLAPAIGSAVGMETVQIARRLGASIAISTASTTEKTEQARADGYAHVIDLSRESLKDGMLRITGGKGVDVVVDGVSGKLTGQALASLAFGGTIVVAGYAGGRETASQTRPSGRSTSISRNRLWLICESVLKTRAGPTRRQLAIRRRAFSSKECALSHSIDNNTSPNSRNSPRIWLA